MLAYDSYHTLLCRPASALRSTAARGCRHLLLRTTLSRSEIRPNTRTRQTAGHGIVAARFANRHTTRARTRRDRLDALRFRPAALTLPSAAALAALERSADTC